MKKRDSKVRLSEIFEGIQDCAFVLHESLEKRGEIPLLDLEHSFLPDNRRFDHDVRSALLWFLLLYLQPRIESQKSFQTTLLSKLPTAESSLIVRQLMCRPPRAWSYRRSYQRGFAHTIAGPEAHHEISLDGCIHASGVVENAEHLYAFGWTISFEEQIFLITACPLTQEQTYQIEKIRPFPLPLNDDDFWEESLLDMICSLFTPEPMIRLSAPIHAVPTQYSPEQRFARLSRIMLSTLGHHVVRETGTLQVIVATESSDVILAEVDNLVSAHLGNHRDPELAAYLKRRILEAVGCDLEGNMPHAHVSLLTADPIALLLLPSTHPIFEKLGARDSIRQALLLDDDDVKRAFDVYQRERRWLAAFPCFDFTIEEHAAKFGIPMDALQAVFDPEVFTAHLPIAPQGDVLKQLQNKFGFYLPDAAPPEFQQVLEAFASRTFQRTGNMSACVQWLMSCCDRWRYCLCEIEPENAQRTVNKSNRDLLQKGLRGLSSMFRKKS